MCDLFWEKRYYFHCDLRPIVTWIADSEHSARLRLLCYARSEGITTCHIAHKACLTEVARMTLRKGGALWKPVLECPGQVIPLKRKLHCQAFTRAWEKAVSLWSPFWLHLPPHITKGLFCSTSNSKNQWTVNRVRVWKKVLEQVASWGPAFHYYS